MSGLTLRRAGVSLRTRSRNAPPPRPAPPQRLTEPTSGLQKLRKSCSPSKRLAASRMAAMSSAHRGAALAPPSGPPPPRCAAADAPLTPPPPPALTNAAAPPPPPPFAPPEPPGAWLSAGLLLPALDGPATAPGSALWPSSMGVGPGGCEGEAAGPAVCEGAGGLGGASASRRCCTIKYLYSRYSAENLAGGGDIAGHVHCMHGGGAAARFRLARAARPCRAEMVQAARTLR